MKTYTTKSGDTWDLLAYDLYGSEKYMTLLMEANLPLVDVLVFSAGTTINVPELLPEMPDNLPFWKTERAVRTADGSYIWRND